MCRKEFFFCVWEIQNSSMDFRLCYSVLLFVFFLCHGLNKIYDGFSVKVVSFANNCLYYFIVCVDYNFYFRGINEKI